MITLNSGLIIRPAMPGEQAEIERLGTIPGSENLLTQSITNRCLLVAKSGRRLTARAGIDLDRRRIILFRIANHAPAARTANALLTAIERLAIRYGIQELETQSTPETAGWLEANGYRATTGAESSAVTLLQRAFPRRQTRYSHRIFRLLDELDIGRDYATRHRMPLQDEATRLVSIGADIYGREQRMRPAAATAWLRMAQAAASDDVEIQAVSAYRSVDYQAGIIRRKREQGLPMQRILRVSAAPGFSEHHTGRAIDVTTPGFDVLEEVFERSPAFEWLEQHAGQFGFQLSFPRNNHHGLAYEPWHWAWNRRTS